MKSMVAISLGLLLGLAPLATAVPKQSQVNHIPKHLLTPTHPAKPKEPEIQHKPKLKKPPVKKAAKKHLFTKTRPVNRPVAHHLHPVNPPQPKPPTPKGPSHHVTPVSALRLSGTTPLSPGMGSETTGDDLPAPTQPQ